MNVTWAMLNGVIQDLDTVRISPTSEAFQYGVGVFTTLRVFGGKPTWMEAHCARLERDARALGLVYGSSGLAERCRALIERCGLTEEGLKVVVYADLAGVSELIMPREHPYVGRSATRTLKVARCTGRGNGPGGRPKSLAYLEHRLAQRAAKVAGFDDALWVDAKSRVLETTTANIFAVRKGVVYTPNLESGILRGVAREYVLQYLGNRCQVVETPGTWLAEASEVFVCNALAGVMGVRAIDGVGLPPGPVTEELTDAVRLSWARD